MNQRTHPLEFVINGARKKKKKKKKKPKKKKLAEKK
jgi:hypothetical protein